LREDDLDWKSVDKSKVPEGALVQGTATADTMSGSLIRRDTNAGAVILTRDLIRSDAPGFLAAALKPGMRAVSVPVDLVSGNAGLIQPGDYVDMILVQEARNRDDFNGKRAHSVVSETVVEKVRVIAVGSVMQSRGDDTTDTKSDSRAARTVTIEVAPRAAEAVAVATRLGTLSMALRSFAVADRNAADQGPSQAIVAWDNSEQRSAPVWAGDVSRALGAEPQVEDAAPTHQTLPREITIMRGTKSNTHTLDGATAG
ncbi:MAG: Flp pilus assembly protein CpaB, partial [Alcaligenaceae bacterium]|nr:Flp pilus assembly protein CpaB [Alcaligenaceae bacterium]